MVNKGNMKKTDKFNIKQFDVKLYDKILRRGLSFGPGGRWPEEEEVDLKHANGPGKGQMCIEAAICAVLEYDSEDQPKCVTKEIINFKIELNDSYWSSPKARAKGLRDLGLAQLGSRGVITGSQFTKAFKEEAQKELLPAIRKFDKDFYFTPSRLWEDIEYLPGISVHNKAGNDRLLRMVAQTAVAVLRRLKSPGVKLLK